MPAHFIRDDRATRMAYATPLTIPPVQATSLFLGYTATALSRIQTYGFGTHPTPDMCPMVASRAVAALPKATWTPDG